MGVKSFNLCEEVEGYLKEYAGPNQSRFLNRHLLNYFRRKKKLPPAKEEVENVVTQRTKFLDCILSFMAIHRYCHAKILISRMTLELGVTEKKVREYVGLLIINGELRESCGWIIHKDFKSKSGEPDPGTEAFLQLRNAAQLKAFYDRYAKKYPDGTAPRAEAEAEAILEAGRNQDTGHQHTGATVPCKHCGAQVCAGCAANYIQGDPIGECKKCLH